MSTVLTIRKLRGFTRIELDDAAALSVPNPLFRERPVKVGDSLDAARHLEWMSERAYGFALDAAVVYLAARPRTSREVIARLEGAGYDDQTCDRVVARLSREGYLNDAEFADQWVLSRTDRALGSRRIAQELQKKGVDRDTIASALSLVEEDDQLQAATAHAQKLLARTRGKDAREVSRKVEAALVRRGYSWSIARQALAQAGTSDPDDDCDPDDGWE